MPRIGCGGNLSATEDAFMSLFLSLASFASAENDKILELQAFNEIFLALLKGSTWIFTELNVSLWNEQNL